MNELMIFENHTVEVFELNGLILFNPYHVGECLDIDNITVRRHIQNMNRKQVIKVTNSIVQNMNFRKLHNTGENFLTESGVYKLIFKSNKPKAEKFQDWVTDEVLPQIRKSGTYTSNQMQIPFKEQVECIDIIANSLRANEASKILMYSTLYKDYNLPTNFLPQYELNGSKDMKSATELLKRFDLGMTVIAFNKLMKENGYLEERTRKSTVHINKIKKYNALTEKGLKYGENAVSAQCQREVQPLYYVDKFKELFDSLTTKVEVAVL